MLEAALIYRTPKGNRIIVGTSTDQKDVEVLCQSFIASLSRVRDGDPDLLSAKQIECQRLHALIDMAKKSHAVS